jgi:pilus assembly protein CpaC
MNVRAEIFGVRGLIVAAAVLFALVPRQAAHAGALADDPPKYGNTMRVQITNAGDGPLAEQLLLPLNKSAIVELPVDAADVLISNPEIADVVVRTARRVYVVGMEVGQTNAFLFDSDGEQILNLEIRVEHDVAALQDMIDRLLPKSRVKVEAINGSLVLTGLVPSSAEADQARRLAERFATDPEQIISMVSITGKEQVLLKVRIIEMQRTIVKQLGVNLSAGVRGSDEIGVGIATDNEFSLIGRSLGGLTGSLDFDRIGASGALRSLDVTLQALERVGLVRTLAEPNLTAISGEKANFLAGGEFPVPTGRDAEGNVLIEYKPFGVGLSFTPMVLSEGRISMLVSTEVSELTNQGAFDVNAGVLVDPDTGERTIIPGLTLPGLKVRRAETTVELPSGGSLVMAGLIQDKTKQNIDGTPGAKDVPGVGALFRARDLESDETELVVIVTPYLVDPTSLENLSTPADGYATPHELETFFLGRLSRVYSAPGSDTEGKSWRGPVGFILDGDEE